MIIITEYQNHNFGVDDTDSGVFYWCAKAANSPNVHILAHKDSTWYSCGRMFYGDLIESLTFAKFRPSTTLHSHREVQKLHEERWFNFEHEIDFTPEIKINNPMSVAIIDTDIVFSTQLFSGLSRIRDQKGQWVNQIKNDEDFEVNFGYTNILDGIDEKFTGIPAGYTEEWRFQLETLKKITFDEIDLLFFQMNNILNLMKINTTKDIEDLLMGELDNDED